MSRQPNQAAAAAAASVAAYWLALPGNIRGGAWMLLGGLGFSFMGALVKGLSAEFDSFQLAFFRSAFGALVLLPLVWRAGPRVLATRRPVMHVARTLVGVAAMSSMFYALTRLPLAEVTAISFAKPLFMIFMAVLFLGERVRWRRWTATAVGFVGVVVMLRPDAGGLEPPVLIALAGALFIATAATLIKKLTATDAPLTLLVWFGLLSTAILAVPAYFAWRDPTWAQLGVLLLMGALGSLAQWCLIRAYRAGEATAVAPFDYARLLYSGLIGFMAFAEIPDLLSLAGAAIIVVSTVYIARREARLGRREALIVTSSTDTGGPPR